MHDLVHRAAVAALIVAGMAMLGQPLAGAWPPGAAAGSALAWQSQFVLALLGAGLVAAAAVPQLRAATLAAAILCKAGLLLVGPSPAMPAADAALLAMLLFAATAFAREAWLEARWDGVLPLRQEG